MTDKPSDSFVLWENTLCNPLADQRSMAHSAWHDGYASAKAERKPLSEEEIHNIYLHMTGKAEGIAEANGKADFPVLFARALEQMHGIGD